MNVDGKGSIKSAQLDEGVATAVEKQHLWQEMVLPRLLIQLFVCMNASR